MSDKPKVSKLSFKGDKPKKKKKRDREDAGDDDDEEALAQAAVSNDPLPGEGKLTSSGVVVMGHDTNFAEQIAVGDSLLVTVSDRFNTHTAARCEWSTWCSVVRRSISRRHSRATSRRRHPLWF